jgi:hypothetical protein
VGFLSVNKNLGSNIVSLSFCVGVFFVLKQPNLVSNIIRLSGSDVSGLIFLFRFLEANCLLLCVSHGASDLSAERKSRIIQYHLSFL